MNGEGVAEMDQEDEVWASVLSGYYEISDKGRLRRAKPGPSTREGRLSKIRPGEAYFVSFEGRRFATRAAHLVAEAFIGPLDGKKVEFKDGDRKNFALSNLRLVPRDTGIYIKQTIDDAEVVVERPTTLDVPADVDPGVPADQVERFVNEAAGVPKREFEDQLEENGIPFAEDESVPAKPLEPEILEGLKVVKKTEPEAIEEPEVVEEPEPAESPRILGSRDYTEPRGVFVSEKALVAMLKFLENARRTAEQAVGMARQALSAAEHSASFVGDAEFVIRSMFQVDSEPLPEPKTGDNGKWSRNLAKESLKAVMKEGVDPGYQSMMDNLFKGDDDE